MKPLKLKMRAFGPYVNPVDIDFNDLNDSLTLISGNTGAGKTTVFDAICCALYGDTSGKGRDFGDMRSKNAEDSEKTEVDFTFELRGQEYRVVRSPSYRKKKNKSKTTATAELTLPSGNTLRKVGVVNDKIQEILGIGKDEFRQIVMIAQNDFMAMVKETGGSQEKTFNRIFDATLYKNFSDRVREEQKTTFNETERYASLIASNVKNSDLEYEPTLINEHYIDGYYAFTKIDDQLREKGVKSPKLKAQKDQLDKRIREIEIELHDSVGINEKFDKLDQTKAVLQGLEQQRSHIENLELRRKKAETARDVVTSSYNSWNNYALQEKNLVQGLQSYQKNLEVLSGKLEQNKKELEAFPKEELDNLKIKLENLRNTIPRYGQLSEFQTELDELKESVKGERNDLREKQETKETLEARLKALVLIEEEELNYKEELIRNEGRQVQSNFKLNNELRNDLGEIVGRVTELLNEEEVHREIDIKRRNFESLQKRNTELFLQHNAAYLAKDLEDGKPCPVCGSFDHPNKAVFPDLVITEEEVEKLNKQVEEIQGQFLDQYKVVQEVKNSNLNHLSGIELKVENLTKVYSENDRLSMVAGVENLKELVDLNKSFEILDIKELTQNLDKLAEKVSHVLNDKIVELKQQLRDLKQERELNEQRKSLKEKWSKELESSEREIKQLEDKLKEHNEQAVRIESRIESLLESLEYNSLEEATISLDNLETTFSQFSKELKRLEELQNKLINQKNEELGKVKNTENQLEENKKNIEESKEELIKNLRAGAFETIDDYLKSIIEPEKLRELTEQINNYYESLKQNQRIFTELSQTLENSATRF